MAVVKIDNWTEKQITNIEQGIRNVEVKSKKDSHKKAQKAQKK